MFRAMLRRVRRVHCCKEVVVADKEPRLLRTQDRNPELRMSNDLSSKVELVKEKAQEVGAAIAAEAKEVVADAKRAVAKAKRTIVRKSKSVEASAARTAKNVTAKAKKAIGGKAKVVKAPAKKTAVRTAGAAKKVAKKIATEKAVVKKVVVKKVAATADGVHLNVAIAKRSRDGLNKLVGAMEVASQRQVLEQLIAGELRRRNLRLPRA